MPIAHYAHHRGASVNAGGIIDDTAYRGSTIMRVGAMPCQLAAAYSSLAYLISADSMLRLFA